MYSEEQNSNQEGSVVQRSRANSPGNLEPWAREVQFLRSIGSIGASKKTTLGRDPVHVRESTTKRRESLEPDPFRLRNYPLRLGSVGRKVKDSRTYARPFYRWRQQTISPYEKISLSSEKINYLLHYALKRKINK